MSRLSHFVAPASCRPGIRPPATQRSSRPSGRGLPRPEAEGSAFL